MRRITDHVLRKSHDLKDEVGKIMGGKVLPLPSAYKNIALVLAGGSGSRLGTEVPKQYLEVGGKHIIGYCLETFVRHTEIDGIWVVAQEEWRDLIREYAGDKLLGFSVPGITRQLSIWNGMKGIRGYFKTLSEKDSILPYDKIGSVTKKLTILIHDAARPLVSAETISACLQGCREHDGVMPALPVKDTVYYGTAGRIESLLDRSKVIAGQAPEAFRFEKYYEANLALMPETIQLNSTEPAKDNKSEIFTGAPIMKINGSTEPAVMAGLDVQYIPGDERNFKITTQADLERFREIVERQ